MEPGDGETLQGAHLPVPMIARGHQRRQGPARKQPLVEKRVSIPADTVASDNKKISSLSAASGQRLERAKKTNEEMLRSYVHHYGDERNQHLGRRRVCVHQ